jgi:hypothetical protein
MEIVLLTPSEYYTYRHATILGHNMTPWFLSCHLGDQAYLQRRSMLQGLVNSYAISPTL